MALEIEARGGAGGGGGDASFQHVLVWNSDGERAFSLSVRMVQSIVCFCFRFL